VCDPEDLIVGIEQFVEAYVPELSYKYYERGKIIHDSLWGTNYFRPIELSIISLPLVQRLRSISQMGFVNYVYPSANHTRFEHSLGVAVLVEKIKNSLNKDTESISQNDYQNLRLAALLHDVGQCLFSHTSETLYEKMLEPYKKAEFPGLRVKPHECLSYLIVKSKAFSKFCSWLSHHYDVEIDIELISDAIVGKATDENRRYLISIINGPLDADKLDYFHRDSKFSGIPVQLDLDRLLHEMQVTQLVDKDDDKIVVKDITIGESGVSCVEQISFNKMTLASTIYNHQKVKACDCLFKGIFEYLLNSKYVLRLRNMKLDFSRATDFLWINDFDFISEGARTQDTTLHRLIHDLQYRRHLKRVMTISYGHCVEGDIMKLLSTEANYHEQECFLRNLALRIREKSGIQCSPHELWIDIPNALQFNHDQGPIVRKKDGSYDPLGNYFPYEQWNGIYLTHKHKGHVYAPENHINSLSSFTKAVFKEEGLTFSS
jgi:HD superfamily phosphohydrolase